jgi:hypothetical protein
MSRTDTIAVVLVAVFFLALSHFAAWHLGRWHEVGYPRRSMEAAPAWEGGDAE